MHVLSFLVNFGANLFALDNEFHTAMDVAAARGRMDCVRFLDAAASQQTNQNAKKVANLKSQAMKEAEKRVKLCEKVKKKHQSKMDKHYRGADSVSDVSSVSSFSNVGTISSVNEQFSKLIAADKTGSLSGRVPGFGSIQKKLGKKQKNTLQRVGGDGNVIFLKQDNGMAEKPEIMDVFNEQDENMLDDDNFDEKGGNEEGQVRQSIFKRPGLGDLTFMKKMGLESEENIGGNNESLGYLVQNKLFEAEEDSDGFDEAGDADLGLDQDDLGLNDDEDEETSALNVFLSTINLLEFTHAFNREHLDLEALMLCTDEDMKGIGIQLGPRKKILEAVARRKNVLERPGAMKESSM